MDNISNRILSLLIYIMQKITNQRQLTEESTGFDISQTNSIRWHNTVWNFTEMLSHDLG